jgi:hypothetical protein
MDYSSRRSHDPRTSVYDVYFSMLGYPSVATINLGRQFVHSSAGGALIDGAQLKLRPIGRMNVDLYGGNAVSQETPDPHREIRQRFLLQYRMPRHRTLVR